MNKDYSVDEYKIAFIICVNNELYFEECQFYINRLAIPKRYNIDIIAIREADSMCAAYNAGMQSSDAKYKIYMHQDVMIREVNFLKKIIDLFKKNKNVGMIGMIGGTQMPKSGVIYRAWNVGMVDCRDPDMAYFMAGAKDMPKTDTIVEAVDGLLMATQYDLPWREDLFTHFDFYDVSQSFEMRKAGYQILVPYQEIPWVIHDSGFAKLTFYDEERKKCLKEYPEFLYADGGFEFIYDKEWNELSDLLTEQLKSMIEEGQWEQIKLIIESYRINGRKSSDLEIISIFSDIYQKEKKEKIRTSFFFFCSDYCDIYDKYVRIKFNLRRIELNKPEQEYSELIYCIERQTISYIALMEIIFRSVVDKKFVIKKIEEICREKGKNREAEQWEKIYQVVNSKATSIAYSRVDK